MVEAATGSDYTVVVVKEEEEEEKVVAEKEVVEKVGADRKSLPAVVAVEDREFLVEAAVEVKATEEVADHMDFHILSTLHIQSLFSLLSSMQQIVISKTE